MIVNVQLTPCCWVRSSNNFHVLVLPILHLQIYSVKWIPYSIISFHLFIPMFWFIWLSQQHFPTSVPVLLDQRSGKINCLFFLHLFPKIIWWGKNWARSWSWKLFGIFYSLFVPLFLKVIQFFYCLFTLFSVHPRFRSWYALVFD